MLKIYLVLLLSLIYVCIQLGTVQYAEALSIVPPNLRDLLGTSREEAKKKHGGHDTSSPGKHKHGEVEGGSADEIDTSTVDNKEHPHHPKDDEFQQHRHSDQGIEKKDHEAPVDLEDEHSVNRNTFGRRLQLRWGTLRSDTKQQEREDFQKRQERIQEELAKAQSIDSFKNILRSLPPHKRDAILYDILSKAGDDRAKGDGGEQQAMEEAAKEVVAETSDADSTADLRGQGSSGTGEKKGSGQETAGDLEPLVVRESGELQRVHRPDELAEDEDDGTIIVDDVKDLPLIEPEDDLDETPNPETIHLLYGESPNPKAVSNVPSVRYDTAAKVEPLDETESAVLDESDHLSHQKEFFAAVETILRLSARRNLEGPPFPRRASEESSNGRHHGKEHGAGGSNTRPPEHGISDDDLTPREKLKRLIDALLPPRPIYVPGQGFVKPISDTPPKGNASESAPETASDAPLTADHPDPAHIPPGVPTASATSATTADDAPPPREGIEDAIHNASPEPDENAGPEGAETLPSGDRAQPGRRLSTVLNAQPEGGTRPTKVTDKQYKKKQEQVKKRSGESENNALNVGQEHIPRELFTDEHHIEKVREGPISIMDRMRQIMHKFRVWMHHVMHHDDEGDKNGEEDEEFFVEVILPEEGIDDDIDEEEKDSVEGKSSVAESQEEEQKRNKRVKKGRRKDEKEEEKKEKKKRKKGKVADEERDWDAKDVPIADSWPSDQEPSAPQLSPDMDSSDSVPTSDFSSYPDIEYPIRFPPYNPDSEDIFPEELRDAIEDYKRKKYASKTDKRKRRGRLLASDLGHNSDAWKDAFRNKPYPADLKQAPPEIHFERPETAETEGGPKCGFEYVNAARNSDDSQHEPRDDLWDHEEDEESGKKTNWSTLRQRSHVNPYDEGQDKRGAAPISSVEPKEDKDSDVPVPKDKLATDPPDQQKGESPISDEVSSTAKNTFHPTTKATTYGRRLSVLLDLQIPEVLSRQSPAPPIEQAPSEGNTNEYTFSRRLQTTSDPAAPTAPPGATPTTTPPNIPIRSGSGGGSGSGGASPDKKDDAPVLEEPVIYTPYCVPDAVPVPGSSGSAEGLRHLVRQYEKTWVCLHLGDRTLAITPKADKFISVKIPGSYAYAKDGGSGGFSASSLYASSTDSATNPVASEKLYIDSSNGAVFPVWTVVIHVVEGDVKSITYDEGCYGCQDDESMCLSNYLNAKGDTEHMKSCAVPSSSCENAGSDATNSCDLTVSWEPCLYAV